MSEEASSAGEVSTSSSNGEASAGANVGKGSYQVSSSDLADLGIDMGEGEDSGSSDKSDPFSSLSAEPKVLKEERLAKAKAKALKAEAKHDDAEVDLSDEPESQDDEWLTKALTPDEEEQAAPEEVVEEEPELELIRHGEKTKMKLSKAKEYAQKGFDYEIRNRELKGEREAFEHEKQDFMGKIESMQQEYNTLKDEKEQLDSLIEYIRDHDTDTYGRLDQMAREFKRNYRNPFMEKALSELKAQITSELKSVKKQSEDSETKTLRNQFFTELSELKELHNAKFAKLGIKLDEKAIKEEWLTTGDPLKTIYRRLNGDKIYSLTESKQKLAIKQKAATKAPTMGKVKTAAKPTPDLKQKLKKMSYGQIANTLIANGRIV